MTMLLERNAQLTATALLPGAIVQALAYSDVFDYPLRLEELHRYLPVRASREQLSAALARGVEYVATREGYYFLAGRERLIALRSRRQAISGPEMRVAVQYGRWLGRLPFIRMVALTGSLAVLNSERDADFDYMLVTAPGRLWTARGLVLLFGRLTAQRGHTICPNLIVSENALEWPARDLYSAREICQMIPIAGTRTYERLRRDNDWTVKFLPNAQGAPCTPGASVRAGNRLQQMAELPLRGRLGGYVESWEMDRKILRFRRQPGFGIETRFDADVCQGNFLHHGAQTRQALQQRLASLHMDATLPASFSEPD